MKYQCDVCGLTAIAQKVAHPDGKGYNYVRPDGWGNVYLIAQAGDQRLNSKKDFCSEECMDVALHEFAERAYG